MGNIYKNNQLVQYMYCETGILQSLEIERAMQRDAEYQHTYQQLQAAKRVLPSVYFAPRKKTIDAILRHSAENATVV